MSVGERTRCVSMGGIMTDLSPHKTAPVALKTLSGELVSAVMSGI